MDLSQHLPSSVRSWFAFSILSLSALAPFAAFAATPSAAGHATTHLFASWRTTTVVHILVELPLDARRVEFRDEELWSFREDGPALERARSVGAFGSNLEARKLRRSGLAWMQVPTSLLAVDVGWVLRGAGPDGDRQLEVLVSATEMAALPLTGSAPAGAPLAEVRDFNSFVASNSAKLANLTELPAATRRSVYAEMKRHWLSTGSGGETP